MDKKALQEQFEGFARWYVLPLDKSADGVYQALETQSAWMSFQHQQAKVEEQAQEIANLKSLIQGHELRHQQNLSIKQKLTRRSAELQKQVTDLDNRATQYALDEMVTAKLNGELQKWVDKAIRLLVEAELNQSEPNIDLAVKALKGEG
ncbi:hypothetical protein OHV48_06085 [Acinetobacter baumannii]|nr:hypothetical protein [Acinetobacter baumannii]